MQVYSCEYCEVFKNSSYIEQLRVLLLAQRCSVKKVFLKILQNSQAKFIKKETVA